MSAPLLRPGLLEGVRIVVAVAGGASPADPGPDAFGGAAEVLCRELGARAARIELDLREAGPPAEEHVCESVALALADVGGVDLALIDAASMFAAAGGAGAEALALAMQLTWDLCRALAEQSLVQEAAGVLVLLAPPPRAGVHADGARAGLENLARTLSIEWARFGTRAVAVAPGDATTPAEAAELVAYLASPAGAYFSGCLLDLRGG